MSWDTAVEKLNGCLPQFNDYTLKGYASEQVKRIPEYVSSIFKEAILLFKGELKYHGYKVLSPEKEIEFIAADKKMIRGHYNILRSEWNLYEYTFEFDGSVFQVPIYLPHLHDGCLQINGTKHYIQAAIMEQMISRTADGVVIKVLRSPLQFWRGDLRNMIATNKKEYRENVIITNVFYRQEKRRNKTPLILYLLCVNDFEQVLRNTLGLSSDSICFVEEDDPKSETHTYFKCKEGIYLKCDNETVMNDHFARRFVASVLDILSKAKKYTISSLYDTTFYKSILGRYLYPDKSLSDALAVSHAHSHLDSLTTYLDEHTKSELAMLSRPVFCENIFDLFIAVFVNIDDWVIRYIPNDLFNKRIGGTELFLLGVGKAIFTVFYKSIKDKQHSVKSINSMLKKIQPSVIKKINEVKALQRAASLYNDNDLVSVYVKRLRLNTTQENASAKHAKLTNEKDHQFHPSFLAVESALAISSSSPGISGDLNPFVAIDRMGFFQEKEMPWYAAIEPLSKYLA